MPMSAARAAETAALYLSTTPYCSLATINDNGTPWLTPTYFSATSELEVVWVSGLGAIHSLNIDNSRRAVALVFYDTNTPFGHAQGLYVTASASQVLPDDLERFCHEFYSRRFPEPEAFRNGARKPADFMEPSPRRMYYAKFQSAYVLDPDGDPDFGRLIDHRVQVDLDELRRRFVQPIPPPEKS